MKRVEVHLEDDIAKQLHEASFLSNKSKSEIIRDALALYFFEEKKSPSVEPKPSKPTPPKIAPRGNKGNMDFIL